MRRYQAATAYLEQGSAVSYNGPPLQFALSLRRAARDAGHCGATDTPVLWLDLVDQNECHLRGAKRFEEQIAHAFDERRLLAWR
ncbi:hypothetical protein ACVWY5_006742 [Bradyrhizobium sp. USDA 3256]